MTSTRCAANYELDGTKGYSLEEKRFPYSPPMEPGAPAGMRTERIATQREFRKPEIYEHEPARTAHPMPQTGRERLHRTDPAPGSANRLQGMGLSTRKHGTAELQDHRHHLHGWPRRSESGIGNGSGGLDRRGKLWINGELRIKN